MKPLNPFIKFIQLIFIILILWVEVDAVESPACGLLLYPLESKIEEIKGQGGIWGRIRPKLQSKKSRYLYSQAGLQNHCP